MTQKSAIDSVSPDELREIVENAKFMKDVIIHLGLKDRCTSNHRTLKNRLEKYGIDYSHFKENINKQRKGFFKMGQNAMPLDEVLVKGSRYKDMRHLKVRLIGKGLLKDKCGQCSQKAMWRRKPLVLTIVHINGDNKDHRIENLILLCPNCRSQIVTQRTVTSNRQRGIKNAKIKAMKKELYRMTPNLSIRKVKNRPTASQLIRMREDEKLSLQAIGDKYGVSRSTIKKWFVSCGLED